MLCPTGVSRHQPQGLIPPGDGPIQPMWPIRVHPACREASAANADETTRLPRRAQSRPRSDARIARRGWAFEPIPRCSVTATLGDVSKVLETRHARVWARRKQPNRRTVAGRDRLRLTAAVLAVESLYIIALVIAIPIGRAAVGVTLMLGFVLAMAAGAWLQTGGRPAPRGRTHPAGDR
jgi:hypothetical protein